jgi:SAM-dependent methyltransferase
MKFHDPELARQRRGMLDELIAQMRRHPWTPVPCVVCGEAEQLSPAHEKWGIAMRRCDRCGHLFTSPRMPAAAVAELYGSFYWEQYQVAIGSPSLEERLAFDLAGGRHKLERDVLPHRRSGRLLDIGASSGGLVRQALDAGFDAAGLEPAPEVCRRAREVHGVRMYEGTLAGQAFPDASWDVITLHDVLEHLFEPVDELREIHRVLAPGGIVVIETPTTDSLNHAEQGVAWSTISPLEHVHLFSQRAAQQLLEGLGFRTLDLHCPHEDNWIYVGERTA